MSKKISPIKIGFLILIFAILINTIFMKNNIGGLLRDCSRLSVLIGVIVIIYGITTKLIRKKKNA